MPAISGVGNIMIKDNRDFLCDECVDIDYCSTRCKIQEQLNEDVPAVCKERGKSLAKQIQYELGYSRVSTNRGKY